MNLASRRELLATFLGIPAAFLAGCSRRSTVPLPEGSLVGADSALGHRVRDEPRPIPTDNAWQTVPVVIIGAGVAGLAAGWRLRRAGFDDFNVLELEKQPGGTARSEEAHPVPYPWGAHYLPAPLRDNRSLLTLLREMSLVEGEDDNGQPVFVEEALVRDPHERLFYRGEWHDGLYLNAGASEDDLAQLGRFMKEVDHWVTWRDGKGRRAFAVPVAAGSDDPVVTALDRQTMVEWLDRHGFTSSRLRWLVNYGCRDDYGLTLEETSAWAGLFYFAARRRTAGAEPQPYLSWPEGNGRLVAHLANSCAKTGRARLHTGLAVMDVNPWDDAGKHVAVTAVDGAANTVSGFRADQVIFAAPQFVARHVIRPWRDKPPAHLPAFEYGSWMVANLRLRDRPREDGLPLAWDNVPYESPSLGYVPATHQRGLDHGPSVFTYYYPLCAGDARSERQRLLSLGRDEWAEITLTDLGRLHEDLRDLTTRLDVMRWGHAMIRPRPGFVWSADRRAASQPYRNVHFAHSDLSGVALFEEAFYHGVRAAEEVLRARGIFFTSLLL